MWHFSTRIIRRSGEPEWEDYINFIGLPHLQEIRSIDSWCNPPVKESVTWELESLEKVEQILAEKLLPIPILGKQYYQLFTDDLNVEITSNHLTLNLLGYDLSDWTWTSSLLNCGRWEGNLATIAQSVNQYGLLSLENAKIAQNILPDAWNKDPHAFVTIWALFEVTQ